MKWEDICYDETVIVTGGKHKGKIGYIDDEEYPYVYVHFNGIAFNFGCTRIHHKYLEYVTHMELINRMQELQLLISKEQLKKYYNPEKLIAFYEEYIYAAKIQTELHINSFYSKPTKETRLFISCSKNELQLANNLATDLRLDGYNVFVFSTSIKLGENIIQSIDENISKADFIIPIISESYLNSQFCIDELTSFYINHIKNKPNSILPIKYDHSKMPSLFAMYKYFDYVNSNYNNCILEIRQSITQKHQQ